MNNNHDIFCNDLYTSTENNTVYSITYESTRPSFYDNPNYNIPDECEIK